jgi:hypothetical protein
MELCAGVTAEFSDSTLDRSVNILIGGSKLERARRQFSTCECQRLVYGSTLLGTQNPSEHQAVDMSRGTQDVEGRKSLIEWKAEGVLPQFSCRSMLETTVPQRRSCTLVANIRGGLCGIRHRGNASGPEAIG